MAAEAVRVPVGPDVREPPEEREAEVFDRVGEVVDLAEGFGDGARLFVGGGFEQLVVQFVAAVAVLIFSFVVAYVLGLAIEKTIGFRVKNEDEIAGVGVAVHGE